MILGIGSDLCDIRRIERSLERFGDRFRNRLFSLEEQAKAERRAYPAATYAKRFAAKEACAKALGTGFRNGVFWLDITVFSQPSGQPTLGLSGGALKRLKAITPQGMRAEIYLTLTDEASLAQAFVLIAALPLGPIEAA